MARVKPARANSPTPFELGYWMPAEWETHEATWLAWPHETTDWPGKFAPIPWVYGDIVRRLAQVERVRILVEGPEQECAARGVLAKCDANLHGVDFFWVPTNRSWIRDFGPIFVKNAKDAPAVTHWRFNAWAKYRNWKKDDEAVDKLAPKFNWKLWKPAHRDRRVVLEGGSIDVNGLGTMLTTEECLLSAVQARNPGFGREDMEKLFREYLGVTHVVWLKNGIAGDDTHGHVDDLARFVNPTTIVTMVEENKSDVNYAPLQENFVFLQNAKDQNGRRFRIEKLPMPESVFFDGQRLPASYANFYIANGLVLVPTFNDPHDAPVLSTLSELFPYRKVIGIACRDLVLGLGTLHCMTQQQPAKDSHGGRR
ncbi:MAG TPA: agmatine deiminase family protein [Candidatus Dormibacteraeota bacterium]|nr:agmatine deiminase family protein [Candidatus Dormibacteraeota bacterium]